MAFYILLLFAVIYSSVCVSFSRDKGVRLVSKFFTFNLLFIPAALRYGIGADYFDYVKIFDGIPFGRFVSIEPGWRWLNLSIYNLGGTAQFVIALTAFLSLFFLFCRIDSQKWFLYAPVCMIMIYMWLFTTLRQMLAMSMFFCAIQGIEKKKYLAGILIAIAAYFFHKSVLIYIPIFLLCRFIRLNPISAALLYFIVIVVSNLFSDAVNGYLLQLIGFGSYSNYLLSDWVDATEPGLGRFVRYAVHMLMLFSFPMKGKNNIFLNILFLYCAIDCYALNIQILSRISRGLLFIFMPIMWAVWKSDKYRSIRIFIYVVCFLLLFLRNYNGSEYVSIFNV